jgi:hypothetical protein
MQKSEIIVEIQKLAAKNKGVAPGSGSFEKQTGIKISEWRGVYWARWGDAIVEAELDRNAFGKINDASEMLNSYVLYVAELSRLPTDAEMKLKRRNQNDFPHANVLRERFGTKFELAERALEFAKKNGFDDRVLLVLNEACAANDDSSTELVQDDTRIGFVYLLKSGRRYKIGKTYSLDRRQYDIGVQLPETYEPIHSIRTDDPTGIENYWHNRFREKRLNGEWFDLSAYEVRIFKKRTFM